MQRISDKYNPIHRRGTNLFSVCAAKGNGIFFSCITKSHVCVPGLKKQIMAFMVFCLYSFLCCHCYTELPLFRLLSFCLLFLSFLSVCPSTWLLCMSVFLSSFLSVCFLFHSLSICPPLCLSPFYVTLHLRYSAHKNNQRVFSFLSLM